MTVGPGERPRWQVQVLGPLQVLLDGRPVELGPNRRRALLAALVVDAGTVVSSDLLADRVWDGEPPANPSATLQAYVSRLRAVLRDSAGGAGPELVTQAPGYRLDLGPAQLDAARFGDLLRRARTERAAGDDARAAASVEEALALWRGEPYADVAAEFARAEAAGLVESHAAALELRVELGLALGRRTGSVEEVAELVRAHPLREGLHASLMLALYRAGRQADALRHYEAVRRLLADELGIDPGPRLQRLHAAVLQQDPELEGPRAPEPDAADAPAPAPVAVAGPRLIGRDAELAAVRAVVQQARHGAVGTVSVVGEAGIGKTRLVEEAAADAASEGLVVWGRCWQHEGAPVMWPWVQALRELTDRLEPERLEAGLAGPGHGVLALLPHLRAGAVGPEPTSPMELASVRLYDAVTAFLGQVTQGCPVVLVLEDMHWADRASREMTEYVAANLTAARLALVTTVRAPTEDSSRAGAELLTGLARTGRARRVDLDGLSPSAVQDVVADRTGSVVDDATATALADRTGGNPFFVAELVRYLVTDAEEGFDAGLATEVPESVREVIVRRVGRLPEADQALLRCAAVVGRTFDLQLLEDASGAAPDAVDEALDRATAVGMVCSAPGEPGRHRFVHALTQQALLETTGPATRRRLHGRVATALDPGDGPVGSDLAEQLTYHLEQAGGAAELDRAVTVCLAATAALMKAGHHLECEALLLRALDLTPRLGAEAGRREMEVRLRLWSLYTSSNGPEDPATRAQHASAAALVRRFGGARDLLVARQSAWLSATMVDDLDAVEVVATEMTLAAESVDDPLLDLAAQLAWGQLLMHRGEVDRALVALEAAERVLPLVEGDVPPWAFPFAPLSLRSLWHSFAMLLHDEQDGLRRQLARLAVDLETEADLTTSVYVHCSLALLHAVGDDPAEALARARHAAELCERHDVSAPRVFLAPLLGWAQERLAPGDHLDEVRRGMAWSMQMPSMALRPVHLGLVADVLLRAGLLDEAAARLETAFADCEATGNGLFVAELHRLRAAVWHEQGRDSDDVEREVERGLAFARARGTTLFERRLLQGATV